MPRANTECTEISVGFGLLGIGPLNLSQRQIDTYFEKTVDAAKYAKFLTEFLQNEKLYRKFYNVGLRLRNSYPLFYNSNLKNIRWEGPTRQASTISVPRDILAVNTSISIKDDSNVVANLSPYTLFISLPQGISSRGRAPNWYLLNDPENYQLLYSYARNTWYPSFPEDVSLYHRSVKGEARKVLAGIIGQEEKKKTVEYLNYQHNFYLPLCYSIAQNSAAMFNQKLAESLRGPTRNSTIQNIIRYFLRVGENKYILCGLEQGEEFAIEIPDLTTFQNRWRFRGITALPDIDIKREQCVVKFHLILEERNTRQLFETVYRAEIRWSHGRLNGNPEAKLYKEFTWTKVPFFVQVIKEQRFQEMKTIGVGGFGTVYEAIDTNSSALVAYKELTKKIGGFQEHEDERFQREVKIQSELNHPNIIPILDYDLSTSRPWFTMPLADCNLAELLQADKSIRQDYRRIEFIFLQILEGMKYAHERNAVHRDLKPQNILLFEKDQVKVGDFGLGKLLDPTSLNRFLTATSESLGSLPYIAPEQMRSFKDADFRADIYSLGIILYECITGEVPVRNLNLNLVDDRYKSIIIKCNEEDPSKRFQSMEALQEAFKQINL